MTNERSFPVTAVVVNWHTPELCIRTVESLRDGFAEGLRIVIVENGSTDGSAARLQGYVDENDLADHVAILPSGENLGFSAGVNLGTDAALEQLPPPAFIWLLNPDAEVAVDTLRELLLAARQSSAGIVSAPEGGPGMAGLGRWPRPFFARPRDFLVPFDSDHGWAATARCASWCALFDAALVRECIRCDGHFQDSNLFMDWDEWDISLRAAARGRPVVAARRAMASHSTRGRQLGPTRLAAARQYYQSRNAILVTRRWLPAMRFWPLLAVRLVRDTSWFLRLRLSGDRPNEKAYLQGLFDGLRGVTGKWNHHPEAPG